MRKGIKTGKWDISEAEIQRQIREANRRGKHRLKTEVRAVAARYDRKSKRLVIDLSSRATLMLPVELLQGVAGARAEDIAAVEITPSGFGLHWEKLDADLGVPGLLSGIFGSKVWMAEMGRAGGRATSEAKAAAARANGAKGGRPRRAAGVPGKG